MRIISAIVLIVVVAVFHSSCEKDEILNRDGVVIEIKPKWKTGLHKDGIQSNSYVTENLHYNGNPIVATTKGHGGYQLSMIDINSGEYIWEWDDVFEGFTGLIDVTDAYIHDNLMWYQVGSRSYTIDLSDGSTHRKERFDRSFDSEVFGIEDLIFIAGPPKDTLENYVTYVGYSGDLETGELDQVVIPNFSLDYITQDQRIGRVIRIKPYLANSDTLLAVVYQEPRENWKFISYLGLYNFGEKSWEYERIQLNEPSISGTVSHCNVYEEKVYISSSTSIFCHDLYTGEQIWSKSFPRDFLFSGFIVEEGIVVANCENKILYGLDAETGSTLWEGQGAGTSSPLRDRYLNGIIYFSGGTTGKIHAVEVATGKTVWLLEASRIEKGAEAFSTDITVIAGKNGAKGKVVIRTGLNAYCVDAYR